MSTMKAQPRKGADWVGYNLKITQHRLRQRLDAELAQFGITAPQNAVLLEIRQPARLERRPGPRGVRHAADHAGDPRESRTRGPDRAHSASGTWASHHDRANGGRAKGSRRRHASGRCGGAPNAVRTVGKRSQTSP